MTGLEVFFCFQHVLAHTLSELCHILGVLVVFPVNLSKLLLVEPSDCLLPELLQISLLGNARCIGISSGVDLRHLTTLADSVQEAIHQVVFCTLYHCCIPHFTALHIEYLLLEVITGRGRLNLQLGHVLHHLVNSDVSLLSLEVLPRALVGLKLYRLPLLAVSSHHFHLLGVVLSRAELVKQLLESRLPSF